MSLINRLRAARKKRRKRASAGYSLGESMLALLIVALLSMGIATGVAFAARQYNRSMTRSESRVLCSTLASILRSELSSTSYAAVLADGTLARYASPYYAEKTADAEDNLSTLCADSKGHLILRVKGSDGEELEMPLISRKAYSESLDLRASAAVTYRDGVFHVTLTVSTPDGASQIRTQFDVIPLNADMKVVTVSA